MADHMRKQIRDAVVSVLTGLTTTGSAVYASSVYPLGVLPCLAITTPGDAYSEDATSCDTDGFRVAIVVDAVAEAVLGLDDTLDTICAEVHVALMADATLAALIDHLQLMDTELTLHTEDDVERPHGRQRMTWTATYSISPSDPTVAG